VTDKSLYRQINSMEMYTLRQMFGAGVYTLWNKGRALYVGSAKNILHRISHPKHGQLRLAMEAATRIEFEYFDTEREAREHESNKIHDLQPEFNRTGKGNSYHWLNQ
jgi:excinuclease UvrABC nuclease subunit